MIRIPQKKECTFKAETYITFVQYLPVRTLFTGPWWNQWGRVIYMTYGPVLCLEHYANYDRIKQKPKHTEIVGDEGNVR